MDDLTKDRDNHDDQSVRSDSFTMVGADDRDAKGRWIQTVVAGLESVAWTLGDQAVPKSARRTDSVSRTYRTACSGLTEGRLIEAYVASVDVLPEAMDHLVINRFASALLGQAPPMDDLTKDRDGRDDTRAETDPFTLVGSDNGDVKGGWDQPFVARLWSVVWAQGDQTDPSRPEPASTTSRTACGGNAERRDLELIEAYQTLLRDTNDVFRELTNRHKGAVVKRLRQYRNVRGFDDEGIWNLTLLKAWQRLPTFKCHNEHDSFLKYLLKIACNEANDYVGRVPNERPSSSEMDVHLQPTDPNPTPSRASEIKEMKAVLDGFLRAFEALVKVGEEFKPRRIRSRA